MLSGIRTGKKKKRKATEQEPQQEVAVPKNHDEQQHNHQDRKRAALEKSFADELVQDTRNQPAISNLSAAEELRRQLASGGIKKDRSSKDHDENVVVLTGAAAQASSSRPDYRPEDFRFGSRKGKLKRAPAVDVAGTSQAEADMSIQGMLKEERGNTRSMDEVYARNVARVGSRYKGTDFMPSSSTGADEDDKVDMTMFSSQSLTSVAAAQKEKSRQLAQHDKLQAITKKCWWWMESTSFRKETLLALGDHVSMVMTPSHLSLFPGQQVYLVPIKHADSLVGCEDDVWNEIARLQSSLRAMYSKEGQDVIFSETVLPRNTNGFWQTRMDVIPVPKRVSHSAPMYFKSGMTEQAEEWGTHSKILSIQNKGLRRTIPKRGFPYFFVEWSPGDGFAQIIESSDFPADFCSDTIAGMNQMDPVRFRRKQKASMDEEKKLILAFLEKWKPFDWTLELD